MSNRPQINRFGQIGSKQGPRWSDREPCQPAIIPFQLSFSPVRKHDQQKVVQRARLIHKNKICRHCGHAAVEPIELNDGMLRHDRSTIAGTGTLIGFRCQRCEDQWPAKAVQHEGETTYAESSHGHR